MRNYGAVRSDSGSDDDVHTDHRCHRRVEPELLDDDDEWKVSHGDEREPLAPPVPHIRKISFDDRPLPPSRKSSFDSSHAQRPPLPRPPSSPSILRMSPSALRPSSYARSSSMDETLRPRTLVTSALRSSSYSLQDMATATTTPPRTPPTPQSRQEQENPPLSGRKRSVSFSTHASVATFDSKVSPYREGEEEKKDGDGDGDDDDDDDDATGWNDDDDGPPRAATKIRVVEKTPIRDSPRTSVKPVSFAQVAIFAGLIVLPFVCLRGALALLKLFGGGEGGGDDVGGAADGGAASGAASGLDGAGTGIAGADVAGGVELRHLRGADGATASTASP